MNNASMCTKMYIAIYIQERRFSNLYFLVYLLVVKMEGCLFYTKIDIQRNCFRQC